MNYKLVFKLIGNMLKIESALMIIPLIVSAIYGGDDKKSFIWSILITGAVGFLLSILKPTDKKFKMKDAFAAVALSWILFSIFGALPFYFSGYFENFIDCVFESISGFTTTGATILTDIEILPHGIVFWRSFSHWVGGIGVLVFMLAVMPSMNASSINLLRAESTGIFPDRFVPKLRKTARTMYLIYIAMTAILIILLIASGLSVFDSFTSAFSTAGTGGFSDFSANIREYNNVVAEIIITIFMFLFGISFVLFFYSINGNIKQVLYDEELRLYGVVVLVATIIITINIMGLYGSVWESLRYSSFQVSSVITTTGLTTADFNAWPVLSKMILLLLMLTGCCAGSTGGGIKLVRFLLMSKASIVEIKKIVRPNSVKMVTLNRKKVDNDVISKTAMFFFIYFSIFIISSILISIDLKEDIVSTTTAVIATLSNVGPGLGKVGPMGNYSEFSSFSKIILSFCMIAGRLELFPALILFSPSVWKRA